MSIKILQGVQNIAQNTQIFKVQNKKQFPDFRCKTLLDANTIVSHYLTLFRTFSHFVALRKTFSQKCVKHFSKHALLEFHNED